MNRKLTLAIAVTGLLVHGAASAQMQVPWMRGQLGLKAGTSPPPGITSSLALTWYHAGEIKDGSGNTILDGDLDQVVPMLVFTYTANQTLFGANLGGMMAIMVANSALDLPVLDIETGFGPGDLYIRPINLGWHWSRADLTAAWALFVPTGRYIEGGSENTGFGLWSNEYSLGFTGFADRKRKWHLSTVAAYQSQSGKAGTLNRPGSTLSLYGGAGRAFRMGLANVGIAYYAQWKTSDDELPLLPPGTFSKHSIFGIGPELNCAVIGLPTPLVATARYFFEMGNETATEGGTLFLGLTYVKPNTAAANRRR